MPALKDPRWERFAQAIVAGLAGETRISRAQSTAYLAAYPNCSNGNSAEACASRLLRRAKPIFERVREIQQAAAKRIEETPERIAQELNEVRDEARKDKAHAAAVSAILGKAKVLGLVIDKHQDTTPKPSFANAKSLHEIGILLLQQVGVTAPSKKDISRAIAAHNQLIDTLKAIAERHQVLTLEEYAP
jgi:phage terminase small subunit